MELGREGDVSPFIFENKTSVTMFAYIALLPPHKTIFCTVFTRTFLADCPLHSMFLPLFLGKITRFYLFINTLAFFIMGDNERR